MKCLLSLFLVAGVLCIHPLFAESSSVEQQSQIQAKLQNLLFLGSDPEVVVAVRNYNKTASANPTLATMSNEKWKNLSMLDPIVKTLIKNNLVSYLKTKTNKSVSELFISGADGGKVCFYEKTSSWCHKGRTKHEIPMTGKTWIGSLEMDESTGIQQVQVSFPVLDHQKPIGSIVVGLNASQLNTLEP